jgi:RNA polymerase primary sigma factor
MGHFYTKGVIEHMTNEELVIRIKTGIDPAENMKQLYLQVKAFIHMIAVKYAAYAELEDLEQEGYIGLNDAVEHYNSNLEIKFLSYAGFWIKQRMTRYINNAGSTIRISAHMRGKIAAYRKFESEYEKYFNRIPSENEVYRYLGIGEEEQELIKNSRNLNTIASLDSLVSEDNDLKLYETIPGSDNVEDSVIDQLCHEQLKSDIWECVDCLEGQQPDILHLMYEDGLNMEECGQNLNLPGSVVRKEKNKALRSLRYGRSVSRLRPYYEEYILCHIYDSGTEWDSVTERLAIRVIEDAKKYCK